VSRPSPGHPKRYGALIFVLLVTVAGFFALMFYVLTAPGRHATFEVRSGPGAEPLPSNMKPGVQPPLRRRPNTRMVPAGLEGKDQEKPTEAETLARKRQLKQNLARLNRLVNEHGSVIKEFLDLMEDVNLAEVLQQVRGNNEAR
jgi:hypothetical protein